MAFTQAPINYAKQYGKNLPTHILISAILQTSGIRVKHRDSDL